jgi:hypothetical protein
MFTCVEIGDVNKIKPINNTSRKTNAPWNNKKINPIKNNKLPTVSIMVEAMMRIYKFLKTKMLITPKRMRMVAKIRNA